MNAERIKSIAAGDPSDVTAAEIQELCDLAYSYLEFQARIKQVQNIIENLPTLETRSHGKR